MNGQNNAAQENANTVGTMGTVLKMAKVVNCSFQQWEALKNVNLNHPLTSFRIDLDIALEKVNLNSAQRLAVKLVKQGKGLDSKKMNEHYKTACIAIAKYLGEDYFSYFNDRNV